jgi:predicted AAA+ superfamily ATPase
LKHKIEISKDSIDVWKDRLSAWFLDYLKRPLPEMVEMPSELLRRYVRESIVERIVYKDIPEIHGRIDYELLRNLLNLFFENPGYTLNVDSLSKDLKRSKRTVLNVLEYMIESYLIRMIRNYRPSTMTSSRKLRKVYPYHFCLIAHDPIDQSKFMECVAASLLDATFYWRDDSKEVDFVVDNNPVEVKWQETITREDYKSLKYFMKKFNAEESILITKSDHPQPEQQIVTVPLWKVAFQEDPAWKMLNRTDDWGVKDASERIDEYLYESR